MNDRHYWIEATCKEPNAEVIEWRFGIIVRDGSLNPTDYLGVTPPAKLWVDVSVGDYHGVTRQGDVLSIPDLGYRLRIVDIGPYWHAFECVPDKPFSRFVVLKRRLKYSFAEFRYQVICKCRSVHIVKWLDHLADRMKDGEQ